MVTHKLRSFLAIIAIAGASALSLSILVTSQSISNSFTHFSSQIFPGVQLKIVGPIQRGGVESSIVADVNSVKGVKNTFEVVQASTNLYVGQSRIPVVALAISTRAKAGNDHTGLEEYSTRPSTISNAQFKSIVVTSSPSLARSIGACPGNLPYQLGTSTRKNRQIRLVTDNGLVKVSCAKPLSNLSSLDRGRIITLSMMVAQRAFDRRGNFDSIYVQATSGANLDHLERAINKVIGTQYSVVSPGTPPAQAQLAINSILPVLTLLSLLAATVAIVLVRDILVLSFAERKKELATVYALGSSRSLGLIFALEPFLIGVIGGAIGIVGAQVTGRTILGSINKFVVPLSGVGVIEHIPTELVVISPLVGGMIGLVAALGPIRSLARTSLAKELLPQRGVLGLAKDRSRFRLAIYFLATLVGIVMSTLASLGGALERWQFPVGICGFVVTSGFAIMLVGECGTLVSKLLTRINWTGRLKLFRLSLSNLAYSPARTATMAAAIATCVGVAFIVTSYDQSIANSITSSINRRESNWVYLSMNRPATISIDSEERFTIPELASLARLRDVGRVVSQVGVLTGFSPSTIIGVETSSDLHIDGIRVVRGTKRASLLLRGECLVGTALARNQNLSVGGFVRLETPKGPAFVKIQGIWENGDFNGSSVFVSERVMTHLYGPQLPTNIYVYPKSGITTSELAREITHAHLSRLLVVTSERRAIADELISVSGQLAPFWAVQRSLIGLAFLAVLTTLILSVAQRSSEFSLLAALGFSSSMIASVVIFEAIWISVIGSTLALVLGVVVLKSLFSVTPLVLGYFDPFVVVPSTVAKYGVLVTVLAAIASILPALRTRKTDFAEGLRDE